MDMGANRITNLADPDELQDAVTLQFLLNSANIILNFWIQATSTLGNIYSATPLLTAPVFLSDQL